MIRLTDYEGRAHYVSPLAIARITEAGPNWHGIACYVRTFDGKVIETRDSASEIADQINKHQVFAPNGEEQPL